MINPNPLMELSKEDKHPDSANCCKNNFCVSCGSHVSGYNCNGALLKERPEAYGDWWVACDNADCEHSYGELLWQNLPNWIVKNE